MQKKLHDIGWSDESECQASHKEEGTEKHRLHHCSEWYEVIREIPGALRKWEQKPKLQRKSGSGKRGIVTHPLSESQWSRGHFSIKKWECENHKSWGMPAEAFKGHVATDGWLSSVYSWKVGSNWLVGGAIGF